jgi:signal peptidase II
LSRVLALLPPALAASGAVVAIDQGTKALAISRLAPGERVEVLPVLAFEHTRNSGVAFGLAGDVPSLLIGATLVILIGVLVFLALRDDAVPMIWLPAALLIGGALGNLADRVRDGAVTDFIDLPLWPIFNLADIAIVAGVILLLLTAERTGGRERAR